MEDEEEIRLATPEEIEELKARLDRLLELVKEDQKAIRKLLRDIQKIETFTRWKHILGGTK